MEYYSPRFLFFSVALFYFICAVNSKGGLVSVDKERRNIVVDSDALEKYFLHIINGLNGDLVLHCISKETDLGIRTIGSGANYNWSFHMNFGETTLFTCAFEGNPWGRPHRQQFIVFDESHVAGRCGHNFDNNCYWWVTDLGFYFANHLGVWPDDWEKVYDWA